jgi:hypothetical protein
LGKIYADNQDFAETFSDRRTSAENEQYRFYPGRWRAEGEI